MPSLKIRRVNACLNCYNKLPGSTIQYNCAQIFHQIMGEGVEDMGSYWCQMSPFGDRPEIDD